MKRIGQYLILATALMLPLTGCQNILDHLDSNKGAVTKLAIESGLRILTFSIARNNPDLAPAIWEVSNFLTDLERSLTPDSVGDLVDRHVGGLDLGSVDSAQLRLITHEIIGLYAQVYSYYEDGELVEAEVEQLFEAIAAAIADGVNLATTPEMPAAGPQSVELTRVEIIIL